MRFIVIAGPDVKHGGADISPARYLVVDTENSRVWADCGYAEGRANATATALNNHYSA